MKPREFVQACKQTRDELLETYLWKGRTTVSTYIDEANLSVEQREKIVAALDVALTDAFYTMLIGLAGAASLGSTQQEYRLADENSQAMFPAASLEDDLESLAYEFFHQGQPSPGRRPPD